MKNQEVSMKLLVDTKANKVLFAEVGKEFVDFLFHIISLPVGTIVDLIKVDSMVGCLGVLYKSIECLSSDYLQPNLNKDAVLKPRAAASVPLLSLKNAPSSPKKKFYGCESIQPIYCSDVDEFCPRSQYSSNCQVYYTDRHGKVCPNCKRKMNTVLKYAGPTGSNNTPSPTTGIIVGSGGGFVKGVVTYMVMDNLEVKPMSTISGITLINKFHVKDVSSLEEKQVQVGLNEGIAMLKASLETNTVLSTVFLANKI